MSDVIDKIKAYPITEIVSKFVTLRNDSGFKKKGCCPFHKEKTPSFFVDDKEGFYKCFGCGAGGDVITFVENIKNCDFNEAVDFLCGELGIKRERYESSIAKVESSIYKTNGVVCEYYQKLLHENASAMNYFTKKRKLNGETIETFRLGFADSNLEGLIQHCTKYDVSLEDIQKAGLIKEYNGRKSLFFRDRVIFPIVSRGRVIAFGGRTLNNDIKPKYINSAESDVFQKKSSLYNFDSARKNKTKDNNIFVVEGYMDVIALGRGGMNTGVAPLGTSITDEQIRMILKIDKRPIFCFDSDEAGRIAALRACKMCFKELDVGIVPRFLLLDGVKDIDEFVSNGGQIDSLISKAIEIQEYIFMVLSKEYNIKNPNEKTLLEAKLNEAFSEIKNKELAKNYHFWLRDRIWKESFTKKSSDIKVSSSNTFGEKTKIEERIVSFIKENKFEPTDEFFENIFPKMEKKNIDECNKCLENIEFMDATKDLKRQFDALIYSWEVSQFEKLEQNVRNQELKRLIKSKFEDN